MLASFENLAKDNVSRDEFTGLSREVSESSMHLARAYFSYKTRCSCLPDQRFHCSGTPAGEIDLIPGRRTTEPASK